MNDLTTRDRIAYTLWLRGKSRTDIKDILGFPDIRIVARVIKEASANGIPIFRGDIWNCGISKYEWESCHGTGCHARHSCEAWTKYEEPVNVRWK